jgi:hypothetical protein
MINVSFETYENVCAFLFLLDFGHCDRLYNYVVSSLTMYCAYLCEEFFFFLDK